MQVISELSAKAQAPKAKKRRPDFARYIGKAMSAAADAGYVLKVALEKLPSTEPTGTAFEEWKRSRAD